MNGNGSRLIRFLGSNASAASAMASMSLLELSMSHIADSCRNQLELVDALESNGDAMPPKLAAAMRQTDRALFLPAGASSEGRATAGGAYAEPYANRPQQLGFGATLSTPHHHASAMAPLAEWLEELEEDEVEFKPRTALRALDLGCGTGYLTVLIANLLSSACSASESTNSLQGVTTIEVVGIDSVPALVESARSCSAKGSAHTIVGLIDSIPAANTASVAIEYATSAESGWQRWGSECDESDGGSAAETLSTTAAETNENVILNENALQTPSQLPLFDLIHVGFALPPELAQMLGTRLCAGGRLVAPVQHDGDETAQSLTVYDRPQCRAASAMTGPVSIELEMKLLTRTVCQAMLSEEDVRRSTAPVLSAAEQISEVTEALAGWRAAFEVREGRAATRDDIAEDDDASELFATFARLRRRGGKA